MSQVGRGRLATRALIWTSVLAGLPGVAAAQSFDPSVVADASAPVRATGSFVLVLLFGGVLVYQAEEFVDRAVDTSMESPLRSVVYGVAAQVTVVFFGFYAISQLARISRPVVALAGVALAVFALTLAAFGFAVVGAKLTELAGERRLPLGVVLGAAISAVAWLAPSFTLGLFAWIFVSAVGLGGPTERWLHASRSVDVEKVDGH